MRDFGEFTTSTRGAARSRGASVLSFAGIVLVLCLGLALTALAAGGSPGNGGGVSLLRDTAGGSGVESPPEAGDPDAVNVLLLGLDGGEDEGEEAVQRTDTLMLARIYPDTGRAKLLSIPRDLLVRDVGPGGEEDRINSAYAYGGTEATVEAVESLAGLPVDHHVTADFEGFEKTVDALGGVEVEVEQDYLAHRGIPPGEQTLDGEEALLYARYRKTPEGDLGRIQRQQQILAALRSQLLSWESIGDAPELVRSLNEHVETDMGAARMVSLGRALAGGGGDGGIQTYQLEGDPVTLTDGREVLEPAEERNQEILYEFVSSSAPAG